MKNALSLFLVVQLFLSPALAFGQDGSDMVVGTFSDEQEDSDGKQIFTVVEQMPVFPGGDQGLQDFLKANTTYPSNAQKNKIQGIVYVQFIVANTGKTEDVHVARGVDPVLDAEALRVVRSLPLWQPGMQNGKLVNVQYTMPIRFKL